MDKKISRIDELKITVDKLKPQFKLALPNHLSVDKFARVIQTAIMNNRALVDVDRTTFLSSCMKAAQCGLAPDGFESIIIPFKGKATFIPMVAGLLKLVRNSGELATITSQIVILDIMILMANL